MTDRQTDNRSTWWSVTAYDDEIQQCEDKDKYPIFVKRLLGGRETCPTTGKLHFQGALQCSHVVRLAQLKKWLACAHFEPARNIDALKLYAMKQETAVDTKEERVSTTQYLKPSDMMQKLAEVYLNMPDDHDLPQDDFYFDYLVKRLLLKDLTVINHVNNQLRGNWARYGSIFAMVLLKKRCGDSPISITGNLPPTP